MVSDLLCLSDSHLQLKKEKKKAIGAVSSSVAFLNTNNLLPLLSTVKSELICQVIKADQVTLVHVTMVTKQSYLAVYEAFQQGTKNTIIPDSINKEYSSTAVIMLKFLVKGTCLRSFNIFFNFPLVPHDYLKWKRKNEPKI